MGFKRLKAESYEAMGIHWASSATVDDAIIGDDRASEVAQNAMEEMTKKKDEFEKAFAGATDAARKAAAITHHDAAEISEASAIKAARLLKAARLSDEALESAKAARDAAPKATAELNSAIDALAGP
jgi:hypothetical protein